MLKKRAGLIQGQTLKIKNLVVGYSGRPVLKGLSLELGAGEQLVITGDNGSGKSTLLKALIGSLRPTSGVISMGGSKDKLEKSIGYIAQSLSHSPYPLSAKEVVYSGTLGGQSIPGNRAYEAEIAMRRTGCFHLKDKNIYNLSGGERQRVELARCLAQRSGLLLLDEPTSFLDSTARQDFQELLVEIAHNHLPTVILVSHDHQWTGQLGWPVKTLRQGILC